MKGEGVSFSDHVGDGTWTITIGTVHMSFVVCL